MNTPVKKALWFLLPPLAWAGLIVGASAQSQPVDFEMPQGFDKVVHAGIYFILGALTARALRGYDVAPVKAARLALILCAVFGITDELHQSTVPGRMPDMVDWAADLVGSMLGAWTWVLWELRRRKSRTVEEERAE